MTGTLLRSILIRVVGLLVVALIIAGTAWFNLVRAEPEQPIKQNASCTPESPCVCQDDPHPDECLHFLYGSIGTEGIEGIPYWIWLVLPKVFPEYLPAPGGYASLGLTWEPGYDLPVGFSKRTMGYDRVGANCAFCHVAQYRRSADDPRPTIVVGGPGHQVRVQEYQEFLWRAAADPRFDAPIIMPVIRTVTTLSPREDALYAGVLIPGTRSALLKQQAGFAWEFLPPRPLHGPGRIDPFNPMAFRPWDEGGLGEKDGATEDTRTIGNSDIPALWNMRARREPKEMALHWDGLTRRFHETLITSAIGDGAREQYLDERSLLEVEAYTADLQPPSYAERIESIDAERSARGKAVYDRECASCHAPGGSRTGTVVPAAEVGTDPHRWNAWTSAQVTDWKRLAADYQRRFGATWNLETFDKTRGYVAGLLDGLWLRGPYLHNGSVPTLRALLDPPSSRPSAFYRGNDVVDRRGVGFVSDAKAAHGQDLFLYQTSLPGNSNQGHLYGTALPSGEKDALVEYLKTL
jgi:mono/diheme cytochrome c family protein